MMKKDVYADFSKLSRLLVILSLMVCLAYVYPEEAGQVPLKGIFKCPTSWQVTYPNSTITFDLTLWNPSYFYDTLVLDIREPGLPEGWKANFYFQNKKVREISIEKRKTVSLTLLVEIPEDAIPGDYEFAVHADGEYSASEIVLKVTVESLPVKYEIDFYCPDSWQITTPGKNVTFSLYLENECPERDNYLLYVDNPPLPNNWTARFMIGGREIKSFSVLPGETASMLMIVSVPEDTPPGDYMFRVNVDGKFASATQGIAVTVKSISRRISLFCPFPSKSILTGQSVSYPIRVTNDGGLTEEVILEVISTEETLGWDISLSETRLTLAPKESHWITLDIKPPEIVEEKAYTIIVNGSTSDSKINSTLKITTQILANYILEIVGTQPIHPQVYSGEKINIIVTVRNLGESTLTGIRLKVNSTAIPNILVTPLDILALEPKVSADFQVQISPDPNMTPGDYPIEIQAVSSETESSIRVIIVSVSSPIPWFWISIGIAVIATALVMILLQRMVSRLGIKFGLRKRRTV